MAAGPTTDPVKRRRWVRAVLAGLALGLLVTIAGVWVGLAAPDIACAPAAPTPLLTLGELIAFCGGLLQIVPLGIALIARRRWRTALVVAGVLFWVSVLGITSSRSLGWLALTLFSLAVLGLAIALAGEGRTRTDPALSRQDANLITAAAGLLFALSVAGTFGVGFRQFC